jgi:hypothetical protein
VKVLDFGCEALDSYGADGECRELPTLTARATEMGLILDGRLHVAERPRARSPTGALIRAFGVVFETLAGKQVFTGETDPVMASVMKEDRTGRCAGQPACRTAPVAPPVSGKRSPAHERRATSVLN